MLGGAIFDDFIDFGSIFRWFWVVFWYILGSDPLQFPYNFYKSQGRACSIFNVFLGSNYMYTRIKPSVDNILIIGEYPFYYIGFEVFGFLNIILFYNLFIKLNNK